MTNTEKTPQPWDIVLYAIMALIALLMVMFFASCNPVRRAQQILDSNPEEAAKFCAVRFPGRDSIVVRDSVSFDTLYVGSDSVYVDTVWQSGDTVFFQVIKEVPKVVTKTVTKVKEVYRENRARIIVCEDEKTKLTEANTLLTAERDGWRDKAAHYRKQRNRGYLWWAIIAAAGAAWVLRKRIPIIKHFA